MYLLCRNFSNALLGNLNSRPGRCGAPLRKKRLQTLPEFPVITPRVSFSLEYVKVFTCNGEIIFSR